MYNPVNLSFTIYKIGIEGGQNYIAMLSWCIRQTKISAQS